MIVFPQDFETILNSDTTFIFFLYFCSLFIYFMQIEPLCKVWNHHLNGWDWTLWTQTDLGCKATHEKDIVVVIDPWFSFNSFFLNECMHLVLKVERTFYLFKNGDLKFL